MSKFFIHGGLANEISKKNEDFFKKFLQYYQTGDLILFIAFAKKDYNSVFNLFKNSLSNYFNFPFNLELSNENKDELIKQIKRSKYIFISGGTHELLYDKINFLKIKKIFLIIK